MPPSGVSRRNSKSRNGLRAVRSALCAVHWSSVTPMAGSSQRVFPQSPLKRAEIAEGTTPECETKRRFSSCSQYQSEARSVRLRKRSAVVRRCASLARAAARPAAKKVESNADERSPTRGGRPPLRCAGSGRLQHRLLEPHRLRLRRHHLQQVGQVVRVFLLHRQDAFEHAAGRRILVAEVL